MFLDDEDEEEEIDEEIEEKVDNIKCFTLKKNGYLFLRRKPKIIRFRNYKECINPFDYYREQLMLFSSWEKESDLYEDVETKFEKQLAEINKNKK